MKSSKSLDAATTDLNSVNVIVSSCNADAARAPCAAVAKSPVAAAAAVPNVGLPLKSAYAPENNEGLPVRSLYAPLVATVAKSPGCVAESASVPCAAVAYADAAVVAALPSPRVVLAADAEPSSTSVRPNVLIAEASSFPVIPATTRASALAFV